MIQIGSLYFFIHLDAFGVEKVEESAHRTFLPAIPNLAKMEYETFRECFEASNDIFWGQKFTTFVCNHFILFYTQIYFQPCKKCIDRSSYATCGIISYYFTHKYISNCARSVSIEVRMQKLCHSKVDLPVFTPIVCKDVVSTPIIHEKRASHVIMM